jgi:hypothetical protein
MRRSLTTLAAIAALTALPATAYATDHPLRGEWDVFVANSPDTVPSPPGVVSVPLDDGPQTVSTATVRRDQMADFLWP